MNRRLQASKVREIESALEGRNQQEFLRWAEANDKPWPKVRIGKYQESLLDHAIQEGVIRYLKTMDISPLRIFLETAATLLSRHDNEKIFPTHKGLPPNRENRRKVVNQLLELYGFIGEFEFAWRLCEQSGLDTVTANYLIFGTRCRERHFPAHQAFYFAWGSPPLTDIGMGQTDVIFPLVDEELDRFEVQEGKNLFDYYLTISRAVMPSRLETLDITNASLRAGDNVLQQAEIRSQMDFQTRFLIALHPFEERLQSVFDEPAEFQKVKEAYTKYYQIDLSYSLRQKHEFLDSHFYQVSRRNLPGMCHAREEAYRDGKHQVEVPYLPQIIRSCMGQHIAKIFRGCENRFRRDLGLKGIGMGWVSETVLFDRLKKSFPDEVVLHHARPSWIKPQHLDIFFPRLNLAVEFQGIQHEVAIPAFGGELGLQNRRQLDRQKKEKCRANGCVLIEVFPDYRLGKAIEAIKRHRETLKFTGTASGVSGDSETVKKPDTSTLGAVVRLPRRSLSRPHDKAQTWKTNLNKDCLRACARHGDADLIRRLAAENPKLKAKAEKERLLLVACQKGNLQTASALLDLRVDPNGGKRETVLSRICIGRKQRPNPEIVSLLLEYNADPSIGRPLPLNSCAKYGLLCCAKILFTKLNTVNQREPGIWQTPLMCACTVHPEIAYAENRLEMVRWLVESGADLTMKSEWGYTPMDFAVGAGTFHRELTAAYVVPPEVLRFLHEAGAEPTERFRPILNWLIARDFAFCANELPPQP